ncbi:hypothetical protein F4X86_03225 [Candidatus Saccharibacteria bacterium]|nr:hypothetical protein [Candidatus Saccharibacteria bacterium]
MVVQVDENTDGEGEPFTPSPVRKKGVAMKEWLVLSGIIAGFVGFYVGAASYGYNSILALQGTIVAVIIPLCAPLTFYLGIETWKRKRGILGYVTLVATTGIAGAALGLSLMFWVLD